MELDETPQMLPPPPGSFIDREELIQHVGEFSISQGYVVTIKQSKKEKVVVLGCDRGGVYRDRRKPVDETSGEHMRKRKSGSRLTNCPFELVGKKEDGLWVLTVKNGSHNHEPMKDMSEHPSARRFNEKEVMLIKEMTEAGLKPRQILKRLRQTNPELLSTPKHVYNVKAKLRQGNLTGLSSSILSLNLRVPNLIGGRFIDSQSSTSIDVLNPATQQVVAQVPFSTGEELKAAVFAAKRAFTSWRNTPVTTRQRIMFKLQELIRRDIVSLWDSLVLPVSVIKDSVTGVIVIVFQDKLASIITAEQGKTLKDAFNDVSRGIGACVHLAELAMEAGLPNGVLNIIHGTNDIIDAICDDDEIKAVSYVGSDAPGMYVHARASANSKRVQTNVGAKSHAVIMPDANIDATLNALVSAGFGSAVQRCTAISTIIFVGGSKSWEDKLVERAMGLKVDAGTEPGVDLGPVISKQVKERISRVVQTFVDNGARLVLDGRKIVVPKYELGNFVGPTILTDVTEDMDCYKVKTVTQQWKDFSSGGVSSVLNTYDTPSNSGEPHTFQSMDFPGNEVSLGLHLRDFSSGEGVSLPLHDDIPSHEGVSLPLHSKDFPNSDGESLVDQPHDIPNSDGISSSIPALDDSGALHFTSSAETQKKCCSFLSNERVPNLIGGSFVDSHSSDSIDVINPATQEVVSQVPLTTKEEFKSAVTAAKEAFPSWRNTPITTRQRIMFKLQELIRKNMVSN
ncbi:hypothetical protein DH2020_030792 [Rehmannia glutinosa]|uniref:Aldehyde dehydrogenase domain-containing protein n=1 Tax=Rehmannia glutinosa TaxID=99300 RepID=A0ABR0VJS4_REHGL